MEQPVLQRIKKALNSSLKTLRETETVKTAQYAANILCKKSLGSIHSKIEKLLHNKLGMSRWSATEAAYTSMFGLAGVALLLGSVMALTFVCLPALHMAVFQTFFPVASAASAVFGLTTGHFSLKMLRTPDADKLLPYQTFRVMQKLPKLSPEQRRQVLDVLQEQCATDFAAAAEKAAPPPPDMALKEDCTVFRQPVQFKKKTQPPGLSVSTKP